MADNVTADAGAGGATLATDEIGGVHFPRGKQSLGADGSATDAVGGTGVDGAGVQRVSLATDVPLPAGTNEIGKLAAGTATIGKLGANSGVDIGDVDVTSVVPGTAETNLGKAVDSPGSANDVGVAMLAIRDDESAVPTPTDGDYVNLTTDRHRRLKTTNMPDATSETKRGIISAATSGNNTLQVAAGAGKKIRVTSLMMIATGAVLARFEDGASGTALSGQMSLIANSGFTLPFNPEGWFETSDNVLLNLELNAAIQVDGLFTYVEV